MPDTNIYIMAAAGTLPDVARRLLDRSLLFHCSVCLAELATGVANYDPARPDWHPVRDHYATLFASIPDSRVLVPDHQIWIDAGVIAGTLSRTQNFQKHQRKECLNDALIYLTAVKAGLPLLTANTIDFDLIQQVAPVNEADLSPPRRLRTRSPADRVDQPGAEGSFRGSGAVSW